SADLTQGRLVLNNSPRDRGRLALVGAETLNGGAERVVMHGGRGPEKLLGFGCHVALSGGAGADELRADSNSDKPSCQSQLTGGPGPAVMRGGGLDDHPIGGPGGDAARGGPGTDPCRAEREYSCER